MWEEGMVGTELCLQLSSRVPWADCVLGLVLADSPMGVSAVTLQGAGREPYGRQGLELIATAAGTHRKREPENYG